MLAPASLSPEFEAWNRKIGAPAGRRFPWRLRRYLPRAAVDKIRGPFSVQWNNSIRRFEYPWAFHATPLERGMRVLEIGGGLSGFQFVLDRQGCQVVNVDPGMEATGVGWPCDNKSIGLMNGTFGTSVELRNTTIDKAGLEPTSFDRAFSISVLEHLPHAEVTEALQRTYASLKPGGLFVLTVDLFINLAPFTTRERNEYGTNFNVRQMVESAPFELVQGDRSELYGYEEFNADRIQSNLAQYLLGNYPALAQCFVLRRP